MLKMKLGICVERSRDEAPVEVEPIHAPSLLIGNSLGDIKVALMDLKTRLERVEAGMVNRDYLDDSLDKRDRTDLVLGKLDEALRVLSEFQSRKPSIVPTKLNLEPSLAEKAEDHVRQAIDSLRLQQVLAIFNNRDRTTPKQLAQLLGVKNNTATEHLRRLEKLGHVRRVSRGLYEKN
jgi:ribosomal protein S25